MTLTTDTVRGGGYGVITSEKEEAMYGNFGQDLARARMNDRLREAAAYRLTRETRQARAAERRTSLRRARGSILSVILWPVRH